MENTKQTAEQSESRIFGLFTLKNGDKKRGELVEVINGEGGKQTFTGWFYDLNTTIFNLEKFEADEQDAAALSLPVPDPEKETPAATEEAPATTTEEAPAATTEEAPAAVEEAPAAVEEAPAAAEEAPAATTEEDPAAVKEAPAATEEAPEDNNVNPETHE